MTSSYKAVFIASALITLSLFFIIMNSGSQNQAPTFFWAMTVWYMYKHDYQAAVTLQKIMMGFSGLATMAFALGSFQEDKTISNLLGFSPYEMIIPGLISFCVHFWLLGFFQNTLSVDLKNTVRASYIDPMDDNVTSEGGDKVRDSQEIGFDIWEMASEEYDNNRNTGIWAMAFAESEGNEDKAKALYLKTRAEQLANDFDQKTFEEDTSSSETDSQDIEDPSETENVEQTIPVTQNYDALMKSENRKNRGHDLWVVVVLLMIFIFFAMAIFL